MTITDFNSLKEKLIKENPLHLKCPHCGHEDTIYGVTIRPGHPGEEAEWFVVFGSDADFCTKCEEPWNY